jgi:cation transport ATPase
MDESYLTGEPFLIQKVPGATVLSGALNGETVLTISVSHCGGKVIMSPLGKVEMSP